MDFSKASDIFNTVVSCRAGPSNCNPTGNFFPLSPVVNPQGVLMPQMPAKFAAMVKISARYIWSGSFDISPILNAGVGAVGETMASTLVKASVKSFLINVLTF